MKKIIFCMLGIIMIFTTSTAFAKVYYNEDFESTAIGSFPSDLLLYKRGHKVEVVEDKSRVGIIGINMATTTGSPYFDKSSLEISGDGNVVLEFSLMLKGSDGTCENIVVIKNANGDTVRLLGIKNNIITTGDGSTIIKKAVSGEYYNISIVVNASKKQYSVYVDGTKKSDKTGLGAYSGDDIDTFRIMTLSLTENCKNEIYFDNLSVYDGDEPVSKEEKEKLFSEGVSGNTDINAIRQRVKNVLFFYEGTSNMFYKGQIKSLGEKPIFFNNNLFIPLRSLMEILGGNTDYDSLTREIKININENSMSFKSDSEDIIIKNDTSFISAAALSKILDTKFMVDKTGYCTVGEEKYFYSWSTDKDVLIKTIEELNYKKIDGLEISADVIKNSNGEHPRIMGKSEDFKKVAEMVSRREQPITDWFFAAQSRADKALLEPPFEFKMQDNMRALNRIREVMERITDLGLVYHITGEEKYSKRGIQELMGFCGDELWPDWNHYQMLGVGEAAYAAGVGYDLFYNEMSEEQRKFVRDKINEKAFVHYKNDYFDLAVSNRGVGRPEPFNDPLIRSSLFRHYSTRNNWTIIVNGGIMTAALAMCDEDEGRRVAEEILDYTMKDVKTVMIGFVPDGAWYEGSNYWDYTMEYFAKMCRALDNCTSTDYGLADAPAIKLTGDFIYGLQGPGGAFNFSDAPEAYISGADSIFYLSRRLDNAALSQKAKRFMNNHKMVGNAEAIIDYALAPKTDVYEMGGLDNYWRKIETVTMRNSWDDTSSNFIGIHGGSNADTHSQLDTGTVVLDAMGKRFISDLGPDNYNLKSSAGTGGWLLYRNNPQGHNLLCPNPSSFEYGQDLAGEAYVKRFESNKVDAFAVLDLSKVWTKYVKEYTRGIRLCEERNVFVIQDEYKLESNISELYWYIHTIGDISVSDDGKSACITIDNIQLQVEQLTNCSGRFMVMDALPIPGSASDIPGQNQNVKFKKLAFCFDEICDGAFSVALVPKNLDAPHDYKLPAFEKLSDWKLEDDSDYVEKNPLPLSFIKVDGEVIADFDPYTNLYSYNVPFGDAHMPEITASDNAKIIMPDSLRGEATIIAGEGASENIYTIRFNRNVAFALPGTVCENTPLNIAASSEPQEENKKENVFDKNLSTRWSSLAPCNITYDLGEEKAIDYIGIAYYLGSSRQTDVEISISEDGENWERCYSGLSSGTTDEMEYYDVGPTRGRYVMIKGLDSPTGWISITELSVFLKQ